MQDLLKQYSRSWSKLILPTGPAHVHLRHAPAAPLRHRNIYHPREKLT